MVDRIDVRRK